MNGVRGAIELQHVCGDVANPLRKMQEQQEFSYPGFGEGVRPRPAGGRNGLLGSLAFWRWVACFWLLN